MQKIPLKLFVAAAALVVSTAVQALGMGGINVTSALGQQLQAEIDLVAVGKSDRDELTARLATSQAYKDAGLEYPHGNRFSFRLETRLDGEPYLKVSSEQPINDPFVSLLVELTWPSGKLLREYTFLLDPPGYVPEQSAPSEVQVVSPVMEMEPYVAPEAPVEMAPLEAGMPSWEQPVPAETAPAGTMPGEQGVYTEPAPVPDISDWPTDSSLVPDEQPPAPEIAEKPDFALSPESWAPSPEQVTVPKGSTLYILAKQYKPDNTSVERMLVAMYRVNAEEFDGRNMNRIRAGKILRLPDDSEVADISQREAEREIRIQAADWNAYRQKLAGAAAAGPQAQAPQQIAVGRISSSVIDQAPVAKESAKEILRLSKGEAPGDQAVAAAGGKGMSAQDRNNAAQEDAIAQSKAAEEERMRAKMLQENLELAKQLEQAKKEKAELEAKASAGVVAIKDEPVTPPAPAAVAKVESAAKPKPKAAPVVAPKAPVPEPTLVDQMLSEPLYLGGGIALLLALGGGGFVLIRRKKKSFEEGEIAGGSDIGASTGRLTPPVVPSPDTGDFTRMDAAAPVAASQAPAKPQAPLEPENVDPLAEADLFLSFGRDEQAEEILRDALGSTPSDHRIHLKLLGIYANRQDAEAFGAIARQLKDSGDDFAWQQAAEMGLRVEPDNPLYGGRSMEDTGSATVQMAAVDLAHSTPEVTESALPQQPSALDFDFNVNAASESSLEQTAVLTDAGTETDLAAAMDFDITSTSPSLSESETVSSIEEPMVFDVTGSHPSPEGGDEGGAEKDSGMAFTLDFPVGGAESEESPAATMESPASADLSGINLNFDDTQVMGGDAEPGVQNDQWQEVATKLDLAKAYQEMGDADGAREILNEVLREGDADQQAAAKTMFAQLG